MRQLTAHEETMASVGMGDLAGGRRLGTAIQPTSRELMGWLLYAWADQLYALDAEGAEGN